MREQLLDGDCLLARGGEFRPIRGDRTVERQASALDQLHHGGRCNDLGQGRQIEDCVRPHGRRAGDDRLGAEGTEVRDPAALADQYDRAGNVTCVDLFPDDVTDFGEATGNRRRGPRRDSCNQKQAEASDEELSDGSCHESSSTGA